MSIDDQQFRNFVDELKDKADLVDVIQTATPEYRFERAGKWMRCRKPDSLMVDPNWQQYTWFSQTGTSGHEWETGDVFDWLTRHNNMDFWQACSFLASRLGIQMPRGISGTSNEDAARAVRVKYEIYEVAQRWFMEKLRGSTTALDYCRRSDGGRAFADETICYQATAAEAMDPGSMWKFQDETIERAKAVEVDRRETTPVVHGAGLGFSGGTPDAAEDLRKTFLLYSIDPELPAAVALCGLRNGVKGWCEKHQVEAQENWLKNNRIYGMADFPRLVYPHFQRGKVAYFTGRGLAWEGERLISDPDKAHKSYNPPAVLAGERQRYFNWLFNRKAERVIIVEGQADAISLAELGYPAVALCGLAADQSLAEILKDIPLKYVALDSDKRGQAAMVAVSQLFGPMTRLVNWGEDREVEQVEEVLQIRQVEEAAEVEDPLKAVDPLVEQAMEVLKNKQDVNVSTLQRQMRIGYARAARLMDELEEMGLVGPVNGNHKRPVLLKSDEEVANLIENTPIVESIPNE